MGDSALQRRQAQVGQGAPRVQQWLRTESANLLRRTRAGTAGGESRDDSGLSLSAELW